MNSRFNNPQPGIFKRRPPELNYTTGRKRTTVLIAKGSNFPDEPEDLDSPDAALNCLTFPHKKEKGRRREASKEPRRGISILSSSTPHARKNQRNKCS